MIVLVRKRSGCGRSVEVSKVEASGVGGGNRVLLETY